MKNLKRSLLAVVACLILMPAAFAGDANTGPGGVPTPTPTPLGGSYSEPIEEPTEDTSLLLTLTQLALMLL